MDIVLTGHMVKGMGLLSASRTLEREQRFYDTHWNTTGEVNHAGERERIELTTSVIPPDCNRILDVGCGDGRLSQTIRQGRECFLVGLDLSMTGLRRLSGTKCCASAAKLPFKSRSFDLVVSTEMLEHLPEEIYTQVLREMSRVAKQAILITVPNEENLDENLAHCRSCGNRFHIWGHLRSYSESTLASLFTEFRLEKSVAFGDEVETYNTRLLSIRHNLAGGFAWEDRTACYFCRSTVRPAPRRPFLHRVCDSLNARFWAPFSKRPAWLLGLYSRSEPT
jgi:SAM-dependent methyltransferase